MRPLSVPELLTVWERGLAARACERALAILSVASPEWSQAALARLSIGRRDASLLTLREWAFGSDLAILAPCPRCAQTLELRLHVADLRPSFEGTGDLEASVVSRDYEVTCRPPNTEDLVACIEPDLEASRRKLFARCVIDARHNGEPVAAQNLPDAVAWQVMERVAAIDPGADARVELTCPDCEYRWNEPFDIVSFFWTEIDAWARRLLRDVHVLASAYGWRESDILALSPMRRQMYLAMAQT